VAEIARSIASSICEENDLDYHCLGKIFERNENIEFYRSRVSRFRNKKNLILIRNPSITSSRLLQCRLMPFL